MPTTYTPWTHYLRRITREHPHYFTQEPKMSSTFQAPSQESPTTLHLVPILGADELRKGWDLAVIRERDNACVMIAQIHPLAITVRVGQAHVWQPDGTRVDASYDLLAWRKFDGAWTVIDSRVSALLPQIDAEIEQ